MIKFSSTKAEAQLTETIVNKAFHDFTEAIYLWEKWLYQCKVERRNAENDSPILDKRAHAELLTIFSVYVTKKGRNYDRLENLVCSAHPEYEFEKNSVEIDIINKSMATVVFKKKHGTALIYRLTFLISDGAYTIKKREFQDQEKWQNTYI
ncbi:NTF2 fold immunity protein [Pseudomonas syringae pv. actinidifoliorum]|nr:NTF2 fold immunity protein [Pseudomonas syringae pv. actinidifoliorum]MDU8524417.1 NTF2 fold immunity protein [Pseudomonas syringae pv. actinidifoliorum]MDU8527291.1 NTF2 fold immunity protein [Pseudomonas syringae pv. actinidifoliorum]